MNDVPTVLRGLAIDPGAHSGHSIHVISKGTIKLEQSGVVSGDECAAIASVCKRARDLGCSVAWIEDQYVDEEKANYDSVKKLMRSAGRWAQACEERGLSVEWVNPSKWQHAMLGSARMKRDALKMMAAARVRREYKIEPEKNEADAILIGRYEADKIVLQQRAVRKDVTVQVQVQKVTQDRGRGRRQRK